MKPDITPIIARLQEILDNAHNNSPDVIGGFIVGATIVRDDIDSLYDQYPDLEEIAEFGAELETVRDIHYANELLRKIRVKLDNLKHQAQNPS